MSMQSYLSVRQKKAPSALSKFAGFLIALLMVFMVSTTALAQTRVSVRQRLDADPPQNLARAGVSVVRLLVTYHPDKANAPGDMIECTGLGVLIASWPNQGPTDQNNWVLTDGSLVNKDTKATCAATQPKATLSSIEITMSKSYTPQVLNFPAPDVTAVQCSAKPCNNGMALFSFNTDSVHTQPHLDVAGTDSSQVAGIALTKSATALDTPVLPFIRDQQRKQQFDAQITQFLTPNQLPLKNGKLNGEQGTPIVDSNGELSGVLLSNNTITTAQEIGAFLGSVSALNAPALNPLHDNWNSGITNYYQKNYNAAYNAFQAAGKANPQFIGAQNFAQTASAHLSVQGQSEGATSNDSGSGPFGQLGSIKIAGVKVPLLLISIAALVLLALLLLLITWIVGRVRSKRRRQQRLREEYAEAERKATIDAPRIAEMEATPAPQDVLVRRTSSELPVSTGALAVPMLPCPRCGQPVARGTTTCSNCHQLLSPSESGLHLRVLPPATLPTAPVGSIMEQPTQEMSPSSDRTAPMVWAGNPGNGRVEKSEGDTTMMYDVHQLAGQRLGVVVGVNSDPGIKRKYKPNEDSLFAAQGASTLNSHTMPFGLFVVADGMGGHANGQDASRRAIQTIIDFMLPKLMNTSEWSSDALAQLMSEGIQQANRAVHQNNVELHADMGTTVTAALVVNTTAYVCNVGDSRTYIYREGEGLRKVTNDHSVVASLVEAGIIKPDDIYTHPKRNQIYRSLGEKPVVEVDTFIVQLQMGDKLLLCSDGLWDMVRDPKIEEVIKTAVPDPNMTAGALIQAALNGGGEDNVSVIVVSIVESKQQALPPGVQLLAKPDSVQMPHI